MPTDPVTSGHMKFKGHLNYSFNAIDDGDEVRFSFGPFPEGYPIAEILIQYNARVAGNDSSCQIRGAWSEKYNSAKNLGGMVAVNTLESIFGQGPGESSPAFTLIPPTTGSAERRFSIYQPIPKSFRYITFALVGVNAQMDLQFSLIPGPFLEGSSHV